MVRERNGTRRWGMEWSLTGCFCGWKVANLAKFARFSTWVDKQPVERNGMTAWILWHGVTEPLMLWGAEVGEMNESVMKFRNRSE